MLLPNSTAKIKVVRVNVYCDFSLLDKLTSIEFMEVYPPELGFTYGYYAVEQDEITYKFSLLFISHQRVVTPIRFLSKQSEFHILLFEDNSNLDSISNLFCFLNRGNQLILLYKDIKPSILQLQKLGLCSSILDVCKLESELGNVSDLRHILLKFVG